jgi:hypothetical protein
MKLKYFHLIFVIALSLSISHCAFGPTHGVIWTETKFPGEFNTENTIVAKRFGKGCLTSVLGLISLGDAGAGSVARENGISRIATIDHSFTALLFPLYGRYCTIVGGE